MPFWNSSSSAPFLGSAILGEQGVINVTLLKLGLIHEPLQMLYSEGAVIMGLLHFLLPYMILNVYVNLESINDPHADFRYAFDGMHQRAGVP